MSHDSRRGVTWESGDSIRIEGIRTSITGMKRKSLPQETFLWKNPQNLQFSQVQILKAQDLPWDYFISCSVIKCALLILSSSHRQLLMYSMLMKMLLCNAESQQHAHCSPSNSLRYHSFYADPLYCSSRRKLIQLWTTAFWLFILAFY
jgi:hypothetical protein